MTDPLEPIMRRVEEATAHLDSVSREPVGAVPVEDVEAAVDEAFAAWNNLRDALEASVAGMRRLAGYKSKNSPL